MIGLEVGRLDLFGRVWTLVKILVFVLWEFRRTGETKRMDGAATHATGHGAQV
jgi:hypothetical protein